MKFWLALLAAWVLACGLSPAGWSAESAGSTKSMGQFGILVPEGEPFDQIRPLLDQRNLGSVVSSVAPTPGGIGAVEATLIAGLTAAGMESTTAIAAVILFRLATFWIPLLPGWGALVLMQRSGDL